MSGSFVFPNPLTAPKGGTGLTSITFGYALVGGSNNTFSQAAFPHRVATATAIDGKVAAATAVHAVPTGKTFHLLDLVIKPNTVTNYVDAPSVSVGVSGLYNQWCGTRPIFNHNTAYEESLAQSEAIGNGNPIHYVFQSGESVYVNVAVAAATTTVFTFDAYCYGSYD